MNNREIIYALENIIDTERELKEQIDKLNVAIRCNAILSSMGSDELKRQEDIVDNIEIGDFSMPCLSGEELAERERNRKKMDFSLDKGVEIHSPVLSDEELDKRVKNRSKMDFSLSRDSSMESEKLSDEDIEKRAKKRDGIDFSLGTPFESEKLSDEELAKRAKNREEIKESLKKIGEGKEDEDK